MTRPSGRLVAGFLDALASERGASANTIEAYRRDLGDYEAYLAESGLDAVKAEPAHVRDYLSSRGGKALKAASLARRLSAIRQFHKHLYAEGRRRDDPTMAIEGPRRARSLPRMLTIEEVDRLITTAREGLDLSDRPLRERLAAARSACLIEVIYASGMRISEVLSLPKSAARLKEPLLTVRGKGGRERLAVLSNPARAAMTAYRALLAQAAPGAAVSPWLFPADSASGHITGERLPRDVAARAVGGKKPGRCGRITRQAFARDLKTIAAAAGISAAR